MTDAELKKLSRAEKLKLYDLINEKERRLREKKAAYKPNEGQKGVHESRAKLRCVFSGNGAGKTALAVNEALWAVSGYNPITKKLTPVPAKVIILLDSPDKVQKLWLPEIRTWANIELDQLRKNGKPYYNEILFKNGSTIEFYFHQQEPMMFESIELDWLIADEPPPRHIYIALRRGARKKNSEPRFLLVGTPITGAWLRKEVYEPWTRGELEDTECFTFGTKVNEKNLATGFIEDFSKVLSAKERQIRLQGMFYDLDGLALAHLFDREKHIVKLDWQTEWPVIVAVDPHGAKPHHAVMIGADPDNRLYVIKETSAKMVARDFARMLKKWYQGYRVIDIVVDSLGSSEGSGGEGFKSFIQILNDEGIRARATTWTDKSDEEFIDRIKSSLVIPVEADNFGQRVPKLRFSPDCIGCIADVENVQWQKHKNIDEFKPKLDITNKDFLACIKYGLATNLVHDKQKSKIFRRVKPVKTYGIKKLGTKRWRS